MVSVRKTLKKFAFVPVNPKNVMKACKDFKTSNGYIADCISVFFLKGGIEVLAPSLAKLFNLSLSTGRFPDNKDRFRFEPISVFVYICEIDQSHYVI